MGLMGFRPVTGGILSQYDTCAMPRHSYIKTLFAPQLCSTVVFYSCVPDNMGVNKKIILPCIKYLYEWKSTSQRAV